ncbi:tripartite tricarboxylate transporter substrate binding protein [Paracidovorax konjaci]|uniref:Tripartite-type tricarboxylate transporter, receptor component TctC n=1 Tax=Paracidovorax konjaci TaxID=32040 RepID=A0A1I1VLS6_9BURK|nr:tripartite tricarboxylate transporter substrate binding protein [Paracidovorax konjaci]SFD81520.1 Tripartite-type tricarboxylate transporter, receptor component TctC [Paracidovorax konjaci]
MTEPMRLPGSTFLSRRGFVLGTAAAALSAAAGAARAATPVAGGRPVTLVVSYPAGGGADLMARILAPRLGEALGQGVVVDNKPGASGQIAGAFVARAVPDGTTLLLDASSFAVNPSLYPKMAYDTQKAFTPLAVLATFPNVLVCSAGFPARTVEDVIRMAREKPGNIAYASSGNGSAQHLAGALFEERAGVNLVHIPYRGGGPAMNDVMGGQVPLFFANVASALGHIQSGKLRALAVTAPLRARSLPDVPTMAEAGVKQYEVLEWNPVMAPAGLPPETRVLLVGAIRKALADPEVLSRVRALGGDVFSDASQASAGRFIQAQQAQWAKVVRERNISVG